MHRSRNIAHVILIGHRGVRILVLDAESAAEVQVRELLAELPMNPVVKPEHDLRRKHERGFIENL